MTKKENLKKQEQISIEQRFYCPLCSRDNPKQKGYTKYHKFVQHSDYSDVWVGCGCGFRTSTPKIKSPEEENIYI